MEFSNNKIKIDNLSKKNFDSNTIDYRRENQRDFSNSAQESPRERFSGTITKTNIYDNRLDSYKDEKNCQIKVKVKELLHYVEDTTNNQFNNIFEQEICISQGIHEELKDKLENKSSIKNIKNLEDNIVEEIINQSKICIEKLSNDSLENVDFDAKEKEYKTKAEYYVQELSKKDSDFEEKIIFLYTVNGFLYLQINNILRNETLGESGIYLYFIFLQVSIKILALKYNNQIIKDNIKNIERKEYYQLYRGTKYSKDLLFWIKLKLEKKEDYASFLIFNEFLSTSRDINIGMKFMKKQKCNEDTVRVLFTIDIQRDLADSIPNLMCCIEKISKFDYEKEVLFSSSSIFKTIKIEENKLEENGCEIIFYAVNLLFISNGFNKFDFLKYSKIKEVNLSENKMEDHVVKKIAETLKSNTTLTSICLKNNKISDNGAYEIAKLLENNMNLNKIDLSDNHITENGVKKISASLSGNNKITFIDFSNNNIGAIGSIHIADLLDKNNTLEELCLNGNDIGEKGAYLIAISLAKNNKLKKINLNDNNVRDEGSDFIANSLINNLSLIEIDLGNNKITFEGAKSLANLISETVKLEYINLNSNNIGNKGANEIAEALKKNKFLKNISLCENSIGDEGAQYIAKALEVSTTLEKIDMKTNDIHKEGGMALAESLNINKKLSKYFKLDLNFNKIGDEGAIEIIKLLTNNKIKFKKNIFERM